MLTTYLKTPAALVRYRSSLAGPHLDGFVRWLETPDDPLPEGLGAAYGSEIPPPRRGRPLPYRPRARDQRRVRPLRRGRRLHAPRTVGRAAACHGRSPMRFPRV